MAINPAPSSAGNGLKNAVDTIIAPNDAFASIDTVPTWGWAFLITVVLVMIGSFLMTQAQIHAITAEWPSMLAKNPQAAALSDDQKATQLAITIKIMGFAWVIAALVCPIFFLLNTVVMTIFNAIGRGQGTFGKYWAASCNIGVVAGGLGAIVLGIIVTVRGPESFNTMQSVQGAMLSLGWLAPGSGPKMLALLGAITPFTLWAAWLNVQALLVIGRVPKLHAWLAAALSILLPALFAVAFAK